MAPQPLSLEEVVRQHKAAARQQRPQELDADLRRLKAEHLKARGDEALKQGNHRQAWERYSEAIDLMPGKDSLPALHSNRSLAYMKALRYEDALQDADAAARLSPGWYKAHWRRAVALLAIKRTPEAVLAFREAWRLADGDAKKESKTRLWAAVQRLTREQLGRGILALVAELEGHGNVEAPKAEAASEHELSEGLFRVMKDAHKGERRPGSYYHSYMNWLQHGIPPAEAYVQRAAAHCRSRCYLQARADAQAAVDVLLEAAKKQQQQQQQQQGATAAHTGPLASDAAPVQPSGDDCKGAVQQQLPAPLSEEVLKLQLARGYCSLGKACLAEIDHPDRDCRNAAKALIRASQLDPSSEEMLDQLSHACEDLSSQQLDEIQREIFHEGGAAGGGVLNGGLLLPAALGAAGRIMPGQRLFQAVLRLAFPAARASNCSSRARELLRCGVAAAVGVDPLAVSIERVLAPTAARPHLVVLMHVTVGSDVLKASQLVKAVSCSGGPEDDAADCGSEASGDSGSVASMEEEDDGPETPQPGGMEAATSSPHQLPEAALSARNQQQAEKRRQLAALHQQQAAELSELLGGQQLTALLGMPELRLCSGEVADITPACAGASEAERAQQEAINRGGAEVAPEQDRRLAVPARPKLELELPYKLYKLVRADGSLVERVDKHPFCMSRVYYNPTEKPEEVWTELMDGSCRWRQTGGEVKVLALKVPQELPSRQLAVDIQPYSVKVWNRSSGEIYLEGGLERGVVPEDCFWTHCNGEGEDGCALYLRKMNLELLKQHWQHSEMWWPRLFKCHGEIAWDDYEKDYSDLPAEVLARHRITEAIKDDERREQDHERTKRELLQEADDVRKRARQERLNELRTGRRVDWVQLDRGLPAGPEA
ncbi:Serine/threonine-protein phosphatase T [Chlorella vulgaris]